MKQDFFDYLKDISTNHLIIVEGRKDKRILELMGIKNVYAIYEMKKINFRRYKKAIILTDNDKKGRKIYEKIRERLLAEDIIDDKVIREKFFRKIGKIRIDEIYRKINDLYLNNTF